MLDGISVDQGYAMIEVWVREIESNRESNDFELDPKEIQRNLNTPSDSLLHVLSQYSSYALRKCL